jgi:MGT family glycosyltransferase
MSRYAFFNLPARGHLNPTLPIVKELVAGGDEVHYFVGEEYSELVEAAGAIFHSLPSLNRLGDQKNEVSSPPGDKQIALMPFAMAYQAPLVVPQLVETLRTLNPDCLVYNSLSLWPRLAGRIIGIPSVGFRPFHGPRGHRSVVAPFASDRLARLAAATDRELARLMSSFGRAPLTLEELVSQVEDMTLVFVPREFQYQAEAFDERFVFVGPSFIEGNLNPGPWKMTHLEGVCERIFRSGPCEMTIQSSIERASLRSSRMSGRLYVGRRACRRIRTLRSRVFNSTTRVA